VRLGFTQVKSNQQGDPVDTPTPSKTRSSVRCLAYHYAKAEACRNQATDRIDLGLAEEPNGRTWAVMISIPVCADHFPLVEAVMEEAEPLSLRTLRFATYGIES
jgi:hypothetical protein